MWTRKSVKQKGKTALSFNYWKCILVALILSVVIGAVGGASSGTSGVYLPQVTEQYTSDDINDSGITIDVNGQNIEISKSDIIGIVVVVAVIFIAIMAICSLIGLAFQYFLLKPIEYGCRKFFRKNLEEPARIRNVFFAFNSNYKNIVKTAFMTDLRIFLWSLLFIVPGIIKSYEYTLVPYIMSENPTMNYKDAMAESKKLMKGNKWKTFDLRLSFIGWYLLSGLTFGALGVFFVEPYQASTEAALYESIKYGIDVA